MNIFKKYLYLGVLTLLSLPAFSLAAQGNGMGQIQNPLGNVTDIFTFINILLDAVFKLGAVLAVIAIIYAGFLFVTASGDEEKIKTAKKTLLFTVIGIAILLGARIIAAVITTTVTNIGNASQ